jgi:integrase/recombinase XerD
MKRFESFFNRELEEYLVHRRNLGYAEAGLRYYLWRFDQHVQAKNPRQGPPLTPPFFLEFRKSLNGSPKSVNSVLSSIRGFFQFLVRKGAYEDNPLRPIPPVRELAYIPFIFSPEKTEDLLSATRKRIGQTPQDFLTDLSLYMGLLLMARCGLRISEPLKLRTDHYRPVEGTVYIEKTKFKKDRLIPVPKSTLSEIDNYLAVRNSIKGKSRLLLAGDRKITKEKISALFHQGVEDIGLKQSRRIIGDTVFSAPVPHSLRHSFAINTLKRIRENGKSSQNALPALAAYMGHRKYRYTSLYLKVLDAESRQDLVNFSISRVEEV